MTPGGQIAIDGGNRSGGTGAVDRRQLQLEEPPVVEVGQPGGALQRGEGLERRAGRVDHPFQQRPRRLPGMDGVADTAATDHVAESLGRHIGRQAEVELDPQRGRHRVGEEPAKAAPVGVDPSEELGLVPAQRHRVISVDGARRPHRGLGRQHGCQPSWVGEGLDVESGVQDGEAGLVGQQLPDGDGCLAGTAELGPVAGYGCFKIEQPTAVGHGQGCGRHAFCGRKDRDQRVFDPRPGPTPVAMATPEIDDRDAVDHHRTGRAEFVSFSKVTAKLVRD